MGRICSAISTKGWTEQEDEVGGAGALVGDHVENL